MRRKAKEVYDHDFPSDAQGVALPYGIYNMRRNAGTVVVGTTCETPAFAVDAIEHWWCSSGRKHYPDAAELLILADAIEHRLFSQISRKWQGVPLETYDTPRRPPRTPPPVARSNSPT